jgi:hypothetical protein
VKSALVTVKLFLSRKKGRFRHGQALLSRQKAHPEKKHPVCDSRIAAAKIND